LAQSVATGYQEDTLFNQKRLGGCMKKHWYSLVFQEVLAGSMKYQSTYLGLDEPKVALHRIQDAKKGAGVAANAVLLSVSFLGEMTEEEFKSKQ
jgi:hypothetical protein